MTKLKSLTIMPRIQDAISKQYLDILKFNESNFRENKSCLQNLRAK